MSQDREKSGIPDGERTCKRLAKSKQPAPIERASTEHQGMSQRVVFEAMRRMPHLFLHLSGVQYHVP
jgi:hypothetical protein